MRQTNNPPGIYFAILPRRWYYHIIKAQKIPQRRAHMATLEDAVQYLKGIGEARAASLSKLNIFTLGDLVRYFPRTYEDRSKILPIAALVSDEYACVSALVSAPPVLSRVRRGMELVKLRVADDSGVLDVTFFNQSYVRNQLVTGKSYSFYGKVSILGTHRSMTNPIFEACDAPPTITGRIVPVYSLTAGVSQKTLINSIRRGLDLCATMLPNALPDAVSEKQQLCALPYAYENIHFPADFAALELARRRLIFEELFVLSCALTRMKSSRIKKSGILVSTPDIRRFYATLPFSPTGAQRRAISEALADMCSGVAMNRLIQGDVGSGKTLVAAAAIWAVHSGGLQSAFMAPTEILANQHFQTFTELLSPFGIKVSKLVGSMTAKQKREVLASLKSGETGLCVGTHALLSDTVEFDKLALVVTDEQHRFGVNQRAALIGKGQSPHTLVMSATPIPRTLALMIYGDLDISVIDELPPGRQKVDTFAQGENMRPRIYKFMARLVSEGRQVFVVCPAIDENDERPGELKSAVEHAAELKEKIFPNLRIACIHGKLKAAEKDKIMLAFKEGEIDILVSTTVVEVGVDIPNAALMVVENAERFGLSQLHQLRGRVGRGNFKSYCVLLSDEKYIEAGARLKVMESTNDGFKISEEDLKLRGPGDFFGARQHGLPALHIADLCTDVSLLKEAQDAAKEVLSADPELKRPENEALKSRIEQLFDKSDTMMN
ncbi:MAG: ATP-dependent DNA helicase RecG [Oscillospiraceae bacterium]